MHYCPVCLRFWLSMGLLWLGIALVLLGGRGPGYLLNSWDAWRKYHRHSVVMRVCGGVLLLVSLLVARW